MVAEASIRGSEGFSFKDFACLVSRGRVTVISFCLFMSFFFAVLRFRSSGGNVVWGRKRC